MGSEACDGSRARAAAFAAAEALVARGVAAVGAGRTCETAGLGPRPGAGFEGAGGGPPGFRGVTRGVFLIAPRAQRGRRRARGLGGPAEAALPSRGGRIGSFAAIRAHDGSELALKCDSRLAPAPIWVEGPAGLPRPGLGAGGAFRQEENHPGDQRRGPDAEAHGREISETARGPAQLDGRGIARIAGTAILTVAIFTGGGQGQGR